MPKKRIFSLKASLVVVPSIILVVAIVLLPWLIWGDHFASICLDIFVGLMMFTMILRSKDIFGFKPSKTFDQITTVLIWVISLLVFPILGILSIPILILLFPVKNIVYKVMWALSITIDFYFGVRLKIIGSMPDMQVIVIANHCSWFDDVLNSLIMGWRKWKVVFASEVKRIFFASFFLRKIGIPINRKDEVSRVMVYRKFFSVLKAGYNLLIYPEGRRLVVCDDGAQIPLMEFEDGAFKLAKRTGTPIQPVVISGTFQFKPRSGQWWYSPRTITMEYLDPIWCGEDESEEEFKERARSLMLEKIEK